MKKGWDFFSKNSPKPDEPTLPEKWVYDGEATRFVNCNNSFVVEDSISVITRLVVQGGCVFNCGEDDLAKLVRDNSTTLLEVVYTPDFTKGGDMIRPNYSAYDQPEQVVFPELESVTINAVGVLAFSRTWIAPKLKHLKVLFAKGTVVTEADLACAQQVFGPNVVITAVIS